MLRISAPGNVSRILRVSGTSAAAAGTTSAQMSHNLCRIARPALALQNRKLNPTTTPNYNFVPLIQCRFRSSAAGKAYRLIKARERFDAKAERGTASIGDAFCLLAEVKPRGSERKFVERKRKLAMEAQPGCSVLTWLLCNIQISFTDPKNKALVLALSRALQLEGRQDLAWAWIDEEITAFQSRHQDTGSPHAAPHAEHRLYHLLSAFTSRILELDNDLEAAIKMFLATVERSWPLQGHTAGFLPAITKIEAYLRDQSACPCNAELYTQYLEKKRLVYINIPFEIKMNVSLYPGRSDPWACYVIFDKPGQIPIESLSLKERIRLGKMAMRAYYMFRLMGHHFEADLLASKASRNFREVWSHRPKIMQKLAKDPGLEYLRRIAAPSPSIRRYLSSTGTDEVVREFSSFRITRHGLRNERRPRWALQSN